MCSRGQHNLVETALDESTVRRLRDELLPVTVRLDPTETATESPGPSTFRLSWAPESLKN